MRIHQILVSLAMALLSLAGHAQSEEGWHLKADIIGREQFVLKSRRVMLQPGISLSRSVHSFRLAPIIQVISSEAQANPKKPKLTGVSASYELALNTQLSFLRQYFYFESSYQTITNEYHGNFFNNDTQSYQDYEYEGGEFFNSNLIGYGFILKIYKGLYLQTSVGGGLYFSSLYGGIEEGSYPPAIGEEDFRGYPDSGFSYSVNLGLGYEF